MPSDSTEAQRWHATPKSWRYRSYLLLPQSFYESCKMAPRRPGSLSLVLTPGGCGLELELPITNTNFPVWVCIQGAKQGEVVFVGRSSSWHLLPPHLQPSPPWPSQDTSCPPMSLPAFCPQIIHFSPKVPHPGCSQMGSSTRYGWCSLTD